MIPFTCISNGQRIDQRAAAFSLKKKLIHCQLNEVFRSRGLTSMYLYDSNSPLYMQDIS